MPVSMRSTEGWLDCCCAKAEAIASSEQATMTALRNRRIIAAKSGGHSVSPAKPADLPRRCTQPTIKSTVPEIDDDPPILRSGWISEIGRLGETFADRLQPVGRNPHLPDQIILHRFGAAL
jgi:hypothetical protein